MQIIQLIPNLKYFIIFIIINMKNKNNYLLYFILICLVLGIYIFFSNDDSEDNYYSTHLTTEMPYTTSGIINANVSIQKEEDKKLVQQLLNTL
jgi:hypothetical protein